MHDRHVHGLFTTGQWRDVLEGAGFALTTPALDASVHEDQVAFLARRPVR